MPTGIRYRIWRQRALLTCPELTASSLVRLRREILAAVDERSLRALRRLHEGGLQDVVELCDYERKLEIAVMNAMLAGLHTGQRMRVLDIGCGGGYFVAACRHLGHACEGTEVPASRLSPTVAAAYADVSTALRIAPMIELCIERFRPIEVLAPETYDLITAHKICFNGHMRPNPWSAAEWKFFIEDACRFLAPGGQLVLDLNEDVARYGGRRWYDAATEEYFAAVGQLARNRVVVTNPRT
ncbi:MAG TPA: class I SAM-dependent methyltransferase [Kofleriaceae bacterium]